jgi:hypothetical protein
MLRYTAAEDVLRTCQGLNESSAHLDDREQDDGPKENWCNAVSGSKRIRDGGFQLTGVSLSNSVIRTSTHIAFKSRS